MMAGLSVYTLYVELAHHYMFGTTEDSCFCNPGVWYGLWQIMAVIWIWKRMCKDNGNGTELISEMFIANGFVCVWQSRSR